MARIIEVGRPVNDAEAAVLRHLRDHGPDGWTVIHNFELTRCRQLFEVDLAILTDKACYIADTKGTHGRIEVRGRRWYPEGRQPYASPVLKMRDHARTVASLLRESHRHRDLGSVWCAELVILPFDDARLVDPSGTDADHTVTLRDLVPFLLRDTPVRPFPIGCLHEPITQALGAVWRVPSGPRRFGIYEAVETLAEPATALGPDAAPGTPGGRDQVAVYRARRADHPDTGTYIVQAHSVDPLLPEAEHTRARERIGNPLQALNRLPPSRNIVPCVDVVPLQDEVGYAVVLKDVRAEALRMLMSEAGDRPPLGADARARVVAGVLAGLATAHAYRVVHRGLTPDTVLVSREGAAMLTGFDHAHTGRVRAASLVKDAYDHHDAAYLAPECADGPEHFSPASDMFAAGVIFHELYTGDLPTVVTGRVGDSLEGSGADPVMTDLIRRLLDPDPARRPDARTAVATLDTARRAGRGARAAGASGRGGGAAEDPFDWADPHAYAALPEGFRLTEKFHVRRLLGKGSFGVVYQVFNTLDDTDEVLKIITWDRDSVEARLKGEYRTLRELPPHPNLVKVIDADWLPKGGIPYLRMEFAEGRDLQATLGAGRRLGAADVKRLLEDCLAGLRHLHEHGVYHCDIKPSNLLWTADGTRLLDFNAAVSVGSTLTPTVGSVKYQPPDTASGRRPTRAELADLDLYALGVCALTALTGDYPWPGKGQPPPGEAVCDPRTISGLGDLSHTFTRVLVRAVAPRRADRFPDAETFLAAVRDMGEVRLALPDPHASGTAAGSGAGTVRGTASSRGTPETDDDQPPNTNPFVTHLQTLYSQSRRSNAGTRGLDPARYPLYVTTALDDHLREDVLRGEHRLVVITGNAGDGKTAFLEQLAREAVKRGAVLGPARANGDDFTYAGRTFHTNHDGSQDEGETDNSAVLDAFLAPYRGADPDTWPTSQTRLIAVNEGRLVDFVAAHGDTAYPLLARTLRSGLRSGRAAHGVVVVNLNARDVSGDPSGDGDSILHRMVQLMARPEHWAACASCDLATRCYARHNAQTFAHPTAGPQVVERLATLYRMTHLRGRLHVTLRDLRSALAYTLTSARDCGQIHELYSRPDTADDRLDSMYFTSWAGIHTGRPGESDRMLRQLRDLDVATVPDPQLDRRLDYVGPEGGHSLVAVDQRGRHDADLLQKAFDALPRTPAARADAIARHRSYIAAARRRFFFESLDDGRWKTMLSYHAGGRFLDLLTRSPGTFGSTELARILEAVNRGEGLPGAVLDGQAALALRVRAVPGGTVRSYRLFPAAHFTLDAGRTVRSPYVETGPRELVVRYEGPPDADGAVLTHHAELVVRLDLYELLDRLHRGHQPGVEDRQGQNLALTVFKNALSATAYQEVLLTAPGTVPHRITRLDDGALRLAPLAEAAAQRTEGR